MTSRVRGNEYQTTLVCIDSYKNSILSGRFYNPHLEAGETFHSLSQFLMQMEQALDSMNLPQSFNAPRSFAAPQPSQCGADKAPESYRGALATFSLRVLFRQNSSWQGTITWLEGRHELCFRSVLELIHMIDSTLQESSSNSDHTSTPADA